MIRVSCVQYSQKLLYGMVYTVNCYEYINCRLYAPNKDMEMCIQCVRIHLGEYLRGDFKSQNKTEIKNNAIAVEPSFCNYKRLTSMIYKKKHFNTFKYNINPE